MATHNRTVTQWKPKKKSNVWLPIKHNKQSKSECCGIICKYTEKENQWI